VVKGWVRDLEGPIRDWVRREREVGDEEVGSDEEEIVFKGRGRGGEDGVEEKRRERKGAESGMVLDSFGDVENASFKYVFPWPPQELPPFSLNRPCPELTSQPGAGLHIPYQPTTAFNPDRSSCRTQHARSSALDSSRRDAGGVR
jgi:hypothetical protein